MVARNFVYRFYKYARKLGSSPHPKKIVGSKVTLFFQSKEKTIWKNVLHLPSNYRRQKAASKFNEAAHMVGSTNNEGVYFVAMEIFFEEWRFSKLASRIAKKENLSSKWYRKKDEDRFNGFESIETTLRRPTLYFCRLKWSYEKKLSRPLIRRVNGLGSPC